MLWTNSPVRRYPEKRPTKWQKHPGAVKSSLKATPRSLLRATNTSRPMPLRRNSSGRASTLPSVRGREPLIITTSVSAACRTKTPRGITQNRCPPPLKSRTALLSGKACASRSNGNPSFLYTLRRLQLCLTRALRSFASLRMTVLLQRMRASMRLHPARQLLLCQLILEDRTIVHYEPDVLQFCNVLQRISGDGDYFGVGTGSDHSNFSLHVQHFRRARCSRLNRIHRRHSHGDHSLKFLRDRLGPGNPAHVCAINDFQMRLQRLLETDFMHRCARSVALSLRSVRLGPIVVIR